jgi:predicted DNA-binding protein
MSMLSGPRLVGYRPNSTETFSPAPAKCRSVAREGADEVLNIVQASQRFAPSARNLRPNFVSENVGLGPDIQRNTEEHVEVGQMSDRSDKMSDGEMKDDRITVRFPAELRQRLKAAAHRSGTRESELVRAAVERQLAAEGDALTAYKHAKKAGLIGAVQGASRDLSTNPRHFDGFGGS